MLLIIILRRAVCSNLKFDVFTINLFVVEVLLLPTMASVSSYLFAVFELAAYEESETWVSSSHKEGLLQLPG